MRMKFFDTLIMAAVPGPGNSYRPHLLRKSGIAFFFAAVLVAEGLFAASLYGVNPSQTFLAAAAAAPVSTAPAPLSTVQNVLRSVARILSDPQTAALWGLSTIAAVLVLLLLIAMLVHVRIQPTDLLVPGGAVVVLALFCIWCNAAVLAPPQGPARLNDFSHSGGDNALAAPTPAQYHW